MNIFRFVKFGAVGCTGIIVDFSVTWLCKEKLHWNKYISSSLGFCVAVVNNYLLNRVFTFQSINTNISVQFLKFLVISIIGLAISNLFLLLFQKYSLLNFYISKVAVIALVFFWNYFANSFYTFGNG